VANAGQKEGVDVDTLFVKRIAVDEGPTMKRFRARAMGRGTRILKRMSHISITVEEY
jgi:large subunit ribosomal protein L22